MAATLSVVCSGSRRLGLRHWRDGRTLALTPDPAAPVLSETLAAFADECVALVVGTEGAGLAGSTLAKADARVRIPMSGGVDSLNVAAALAVACYAVAQSRAD